MKNYELIVGNIGVINQYETYSEAKKDFEYYLDMSMNLENSRCYNERVTLLNLNTGLITNEYDPGIEDTEIEEEINSKHYTLLFAQNEDYEIINKIYEDSQTESEFIDRLINDGYFTLEVGEMDTFTKESGISGISQCVFVDEHRTIAIQNNEQYGYIAIELQIVD